MIAWLVSGADWYPVTDTETPICSRGESTSLQHQLSHPPGCCGSGGGCLCGCCPALFDLVDSSLSKFSRMLPLPFPVATAPPDTPGTATSNTGGEVVTCKFASRASHSSTTTKPTVKDLTAVGENVSYGVSWCCCWSLVAALQESMPSSLRSRCHWWMAPTPAGLRAST